MALIDQPHITIPDAAWEHTGPEHDPTLRLLAGIVINGHNFHVEAYAVCDNGGVQSCPDEWLADEWEAICLLEPNAAYETQTILGREYVLIARPYAD